ncbi:uncharacterized protein LOC131597010 [Vicia villosa]|uniref:uncharacterized protein LOC131597010 n=1 Tax=Vicia villosa TaxID=3911 RepID=UPI00273B6893|nr:uncharacterized protein LOC131597010 [Vicia villosa]
MTTSLKIEGHSEKAKKLVMFPFTLSEDAEEWFYSLPAGSITTWQQMETTFLNEYFPASVYIRKRYGIVNFKQKEGESLGDAYKRYKRLLVACPTHNMDATEQMQNFVNGLRIKTKQLIDTAAGGSTNFTTATGIKKIIEAIAANEHLELYDRSVSQPEGIIDLKLANQVVKMEDQITAEVERRLKKIALDTQTVAQVQPVQPIQAVNCEICGGPHFAIHCVATAQQVEEINFLKQNNPYSNTYNPGWKNHPNFSWKDQQGNDQKQGIVPYQPQQQQYRPPQQQPYQQPPQQQFQQQMSQIAQQLANAQPQGALPSATVTNPREHQNVNVISTRSQRRSKPEEKNEIEYDDIIEVDIEVHENKKVPEEVIQPVKPTEERRKKEPTPLIKLPYPSRVAKKDQKEKDLEKFATYFKKLEINIPFFDALEKMPMYRKFMKEVISKKKPTRGEGVVKKEKCCAISPEKRIPIKQKDPGSVAIPCTIKNRTFMKVLIDSGASVSLMPLSIFKKLVDFEIMDIPEDEETPIILGRPFLRTSRCNFDIEKGTLTLKSFDEEITLKVLDTKKQGESGDNQSSVGMIHIVGKSKRSEPTPKRVSSIISQVATSHIKTPKSNKEIKERKKREHQDKEMEVESDLRQKVVHPLNLDEFWVAERTSNMVWKRKYPP